ncbi:hypothetical protein [uncultured Cocleimonas sp.]|jgi:hypothetical protein|nr:hypothetical protein [uncultured Cocleimonas sp.]
MDKFEMSLKKNWLVKMSQLNMQSVGFAVKQILYVDQRAVAILMI